MFDWYLNYLLHYDDYHLMFQDDVVDRINYLLMWNFVNDLIEMIVGDWMENYYSDELLMMMRRIQYVRNYLNLDLMLNDVNYLLLMLINLHKNEYELGLMLRNVQMNPLEYNEYHVNINLTRYLNHEQKMMDKESIEKIINRILIKTKRISLHSFFVLSNK